MLDGLLLDWPGRLCVRAPYLPYFTSWDQCFFTARISIVM